MQRFVTGTIFQKKSGWYSQKTFILNANIRKTIGTAQGTTKIPNEDLAVERMHLQFIFSTEEKEITIQDSSSFGSYYQINEPNIPHLLIDNSFIVGNTICTLIEKEERQKFILILSPLIKSGKKNTECTIDPTKEIIIGREPEKTMENAEYIQLGKDSTLSKTHCKLKYNQIEKNWEIQDLNSRNGTFIGLGKKQLKIQWDQTIRIGIHTFVYFSQEIRGVPNS